MISEIVFLKGAFIHTVRLSLHWQFLHEPDENISYIFEISWEATDTYMGENKTSFEPFLVLYQLLSLLFRLKGWAPVRNTFARMSLIDSCQISSTLLILPVLLSVNTCDLLLSGFQASVGSAAVWKPPNSFQCFQCRISCTAQHEQSSPWYRIPFSVNPPPLPPPTGINIGLNLVKFSKPSLHPRLSRQCCPMLKESYFPL